MRATKHKILVWLPSPMGDAVLCTPALRAIREHFRSWEIAFLGRPAVREVLSPGSFNDIWLEHQENSPFAIARMLRGHNFTHAILLKNSFGSALTAFLARIPTRIGYARDGRGFLLTQKLCPRRLPGGNFEPVSMIEYYLGIASALGAESINRNLELSIDPQDVERIGAKLPEVVKSEGPVIVIVPGGAFGPSKCWPSVRFAQTADWLVANYRATVVVSVACNRLEEQIAKEICSLSKHKLINLAERPVSLGELKALFSSADMVISNDTGPRHIAIALGRKVISLFGPNNPAWTDTGYENEIQIVGDAPCAPCSKPKCKMSEHLCMQAITVEMVCKAAKKILEKNKKNLYLRRERRFKELSKSFFVNPDYETALTELGLTSIDAVFSFGGGRNLIKDNLAAFRSRVRFKVKLLESQSPTTLFLKRYDKPPIMTQLRNWFSSHKRVSCGFVDFDSANRLSAAGINTPKTVSYGEQWSRFFERRSFIITEEIGHAESLERELPDFFSGPDTVGNLKLRRDFIIQLANFVRKFHETTFRHRDLYLCHIFYKRHRKASSDPGEVGDGGRFYLIDLARAFKPVLLSERFRIKDIAQVYYSAPAKCFTRTDRLRFYMAYMGRSRLSGDDKKFIRKVTSKARRMARHDMKHGRAVPFAD